MSSVVLVLTVALVLAFFHAPGWAWVVVAACGLAWSGVSPWLIVLLVVVAAPFVLPSLRRRHITPRLVRLVRRMDVLPSISETERVALEAGTVGVDGEIFSGRPDFQRILAEPYAQLTERDRAFLDGPVAQACAMTSDWTAQLEQDLPRDVHALLAKMGFYGMIIPKEHGGLGLSARAQGAVIAKLASRSIPLAVTVMVPNSLGPAELLIHYGTEDQRRELLPGLASGAHVPCFALTEPEAGSDAGSMLSKGIVERGRDGEPVLRLTWDKRYITLAPVATLIGLAFKLEDPDNLLGRGTSPGITCALIPSDTEGVEIGRRHDALGAAFMNGPTTGRDVVVPASAIIGGAEGAGHGWRMLMECLASGRAISLPSMSVGSAKLAARVAGAHAAVRRQFGMPIGKFEGVQEPLARIAGITYLMEAAQVMTCGAIDSGGKPSVVSALVKHAQTELARDVIRDAMDILGGAGIARGPRNVLAAFHIAQPIGITVEGANILTRTLIVFGQGLIRCHPFAWKELQALEEDDSDAFDDAAFGHARFFARNLARALVLSLSRGWLARVPVGGESGRVLRKVAWTSASFAALSDIALFSLGGDLKRREQFAGHMSDGLSGAYLALCAVRRFEADGRRDEDVPLLRWASTFALSRSQQGLDAALRNLPVPVLGTLLRFVAATWSRLNPIALPPTDAAGTLLAKLLQTPGPERERLLAGSFLSDDPSDPVRKLELALESAQRASRVEDAVRQAVRSKRLPRGVERDELLGLAMDASVITRADVDRVRDADRQRREVVQVDSFDSLPVTRPGE